MTLQYGLDYPGRMRGLIVYDSAPTNSAEWFDDTGRQMAAFAERWPDPPEAAAAARVADDAVGRARYHRPPLVL